MKSKTEHESNDAQWGEDHVIEENGRKEKQQYREHQRTEKQLGKVELTRVDSFSQGILLFAPEEAEERGETAEEEVEDAWRVNVEAVHVEAEQGWNGQLVKRIEWQKE